MLQPRLRGASCNRKGTKEEVIRGVTRNRRGRRPGKEAALRTPSCCWWSLPRLYKISSGCQQV